MNPTPRIPVVIDTDPGLDDAIAILIALAAPEFDVLGLTTVAGNLPLAVTTANALRLVEACGRGDVPVIEGCDRPLLRSPLHCGDIHGPDGLGDGILPPPAGAPLPGGAVDWLADRLRERPAGAVTICALGPLTNLAMLLDRAPDAASRIGRIVAMGGAVRAPGNVTPHAEFNFLADPEAADVVIGSGIPVTVVPLDVTRQVRTWRPFIDALRKTGARIPGIAADLLDAYYGSKGSSAEQTGRPLHDPCVIARLLAPRLFESRKIRLRIEIRNPEKLGQSVEDEAGTPVDALLDVDREGVLDLLLKRLTEAPAPAL